MPQAPACFFDGGLAPQRVSAPKARRKTAATWQVGVDASLAFWRDALGFQIAQRHVPESFFYSNAQTEPGSCSKFGAWSRSGQSGSPEDKQGGFTCQPPDAIHAAYRINAEDRLCRSFAG